MERRERGLTGRQRKRQGERKGSRRVGEVRRMMSFDGNLGAVKAILIEGGLMEWYNMPLAVYHWSSFESKLEDGIRHLSIECSRTYANISNTLESFAKVVVRAMA
eukprot:1383560-Amorphochlora_amoeboformis.AAC.1